MADESVNGEPAGKADPVPEIRRCRAGHEWDGDPAGCPECVDHSPDRSAGSTLNDELPPPPRSARVGLVAPTTASSAVQSERLPVLSGYVLLDELGRGGMGTVYRARHVALNRLVALKVISAGGAADARELARFRAEAEAVAQLQHPNIVQVHEVGEADGRPYIALELVSGGTLVEALGGTPLPARSAAELLQSLANAVQYAHSRGIIHRDLKPGNILLRTDDAGKPNAPSFIRDPPSFHPKIADFGLAKRMGTGSSQTTTGVVVGTPSYMAPEQAAGLASLVGPGCDIYALGAILYEVLTGRPPFNAASPVETLQQVLAIEPVSPARLQPGVPRDLETICRKCLQKEVRKRYTSAGELAGDLRRFLEGKPILARRTPAWERAWKWARRRPAVGGMIAVGSAASLSLLIGGLWSYQEVSKALDSSRAQERRASENFGRARTAVRRLTQVARDRLGYQPRMEQEQRAILLEALRFYHELRDEDRADPAIRRDLGQIYLLLARVEQTFGNLELAEDLCKKGLSVHEQLATLQPDNSDSLDDLSGAAATLAGISDEMGRYAEAENQYRSVLTQRQQLARDHPDNPAFQNHLGTAHYNLALVLRALQKSREAESEFGAAIEVLKALADRQPNEAIYQDDLSAAYLSLGAVLEETGRHVDAEASFRQALACQDALEKIDVDHAARPFRRMEVARTWRCLGDVRRATGHLESAISAYRSAVAIGRTVANDYPTVPEYFLELDRLYGSLTTMLEDMNRPGEEVNQEAMRSWKRFPKMLKDLSRPATERARLQESWGRRLLGTGQYAEAEQAFRTELALLEQLRSARPDIPRYRRELALGRENLAVAIAGQDRGPEAIVSLRGAIELRQQLAAEFPDYPADRTNLADARDRLARQLSGQGQFKEAEDLVRENIALWAELRKQYPHMPMFRERWAHALDGLGPYLARDGRTEENESTMRQELAAFEALARDFPDIWKYQRFASIATSNLANLLEQQHRFAEAEKAHRSALEARTALAEKVGAIALHHQLVGHSHFNLGLLLLESDKPTSAEAELLRARAEFESLRQKYGKNPVYRSDLAAVCNTLGNVWRMQDKPAKARESWETAIALQKELVDEFPLALDYRYEYALSHVNLGGLLASGRQTKEAEAMYRRGIRHLAALTEKHPDTIAYLTGLGEAQGGLGRLLLNCGDATGARTHLEQSLSNLKKALDADPKQPRFAQMRNENYQHWIAALILAKDHKAAAGAVPRLPRLLPEKGEGAFVAARTLAACLTLAEQDASLSLPERNAVLRDYTELALHLLRQSPPASTYLKLMKQSADFDPLRKRDEFRKWLNSAE